MASSANPVLVSSAEALAAAALAVAIVTATTGSSALAQIAPPAIVPAVGAAAHYRVTRIVQENPGTATIVSDIVLRHKAPLAVTLEATIGNRPILTVLNLTVDGTLQIPKNDKTDAQDAQLAEIVATLNRAGAVLANGAGPPPAGWNASLIVPEVAGANAPVIVPIAVANISGGDFDFRGIGELSVQAPSGGGGPNNGNPSGRRGSFRGSYGAGGGGAPGGGDQGSPRPEYQRQPLTVTVSVDGKVRHGALARLSLVETRGITVDDLPYVNVASWTLETLR